MSDLKISPIQIIDDRIRELTNSEDIESYLKYEGLTIKDINAMSIEEAIEIKNIAFRLEDLNKFDIDKLINKIPSSNISTDFI